MVTEQRISVIIPAYNAARYLPEAITSVLQQTHPPDEIIVVDDGSTDDTACVAHTFAAHIHYVKVENSGNGAARNRGIQLATGTLFAFLDADDCWLPHKLEAQLAAFAQDPSLQAAFTQVQQFISPDLDATQRAQLQIRQEVSSAPHVGTLLIRRAAMEQIGLFATQHRRAVFLDWYARASEAGLRQLVLPQILMRRRLHADNLGRRERENQTDYVHMARALLERRRLRAEAIEVTNSLSPQDEQLVG